MRALDELRRLGYRIQLDGENIICRFIGPGKPDREQVVPLLQELKAGKAEAVAQLRCEAAEGWPPESFEAEARYGHRTARLYPLLGQQVLTPHGPGRLRRISEIRLRLLTEFRCEVLLDDDPKRPMELPADLVQPLKVGH